MNSRERVLKAVNHQEPDRVPIDLGGSIVTGIMAGALVRLREYLGLTGPVRVYDVFQMLGEVAADLVERFDIDVLPVEPEWITFPHLKRRDYRSWQLFDGTEVLMPGGFGVEVSPEGDCLLHQDGDPAQPVIARMPRNGFYFDRLDILSWDRAFKPPDLEDLRRSGWGRVDQTALRYMQEQARALRAATDKALVLTPWSAGLTGPPSVGSLTEWLVLLGTDRVYIQELMDLDAEVALDNLCLYWEAIGEDVDIISIDGADYGGQHRELFSPALFKEVYVPCYRQQCDWIHRHTSWKISKHCCGSIPNLVGPMIEAGIDILNPVQTSAQGMDPQWLKDAFGDRIVFWGGGVDTQNIFVFGTPAEVSADVAGRIRILGPGGGFVWAAVHNIQYTVPPENIVAALAAVHEFGHYPLV